MFPKKTLRLWLDNCSTSESFEFVNARQLARSGVRIRWTELDFNTYLLEMMHEYPSFSGRYNWAT